MADLAASPGAAREALVVAHRLVGWRLPPGLLNPGGGANPGGGDGQEALFLAPLLAPWAAAAGAAGGVVFRSQPIRRVADREMADSFVLTSVCASAHLV